MIWIRAILCCALTVGFAGCRASGPRDISFQAHSNSTLQKLQSLSKAEKLPAPRVDGDPNISQASYTDSLPKSRYVRRADGSAIQDADDRDNSKYVEREKIEATKLPDDVDQQSHLPREQRGDSQPDNAPPHDLLTVSEQQLGQMVQQQGLTLSVLEQWAINCNPAIAAAEANVRALRAKYVQEGLPPNPFVGINGEDIFDEGGSGRFGLLFGRKEIQRNKLQLSQNVVAAEIEVADQQLLEIATRTLSDVRQNYYRVLVTQEKLAVAQRLVQIGERVVEKSQSLFDADEIAKTAVLQADLELERARLESQRIDNELQAARRQLATIICENELPGGSVAGSIDDIQVADYELAYDQLLADSPELAALFADVCRARRKFDRESVEPVPDISWQGTLQYDTVSDSFVTGFQIQMPLPKYDQNQGNIARARQEIIAAERTAETKAIQLRQKLTVAYENYIDATLRMAAMRDRILPKSREALELISRGFEAGEVRFLQLLTAQRTYAQSYSDYINSLQQVWNQKINIEGMLLSGSYDQ